MWQRFHLANQLVQVYYSSLTLTVAGRNQILNPSNPSVQISAEAEVSSRQISDNDSTTVASLLQRIAELEGKNAGQTASYPIRGTPESFVRTSAFNLGGSSSPERSQNGIVPIYVFDPVNSQGLSTPQHMPLAQCAPLAPNHNISNRAPSTAPSEKDSDDDMPIERKRAKGAKDFQALFQLGSRQWLDFRVNSLDSADDMFREQ